MKQDDTNIHPARLPVIVIGAMLVVAVVLGFATRTIDADTFTRPTPSLSDPVTIP